MPEESKKDTPIKNTKKSNTSDVKKSPIKKAKDLLNTITGLPNIDIEDLINNLLKNTEDSVINSNDWKDVYKALSSDESNIDLNDVIKSISSLDFITSSSHVERLNKYKDFKTIISRIPVIKKILRLYTSNILAPDDISKLSIKTVTKNPTISKTTEEYISIENKFKVIMDKINIEQHLYDLVFQTLFFGDMFVEILSSKRYLLQTLYNLQIPIKDDVIKLDENLEKHYIDEDIYNPDLNDGIELSIEWSKPITEQLSETMDFANIYYHNIINQIGINENNLDKYSKNGKLRYLTETFYGSTKLLEDPKEFKVFHEDFENFTNSLTNSGIINNDDNYYNSSFNNYNNSNNTNSDELDKKFALDYLPTQSTLSALHIKIHDPDKIIILRDEDIDYGYLYVSGGLDNASLAASTNSNSQIAANSLDSSAVINTSNFVSQSNGRNLGMYGSTNGSINNQNLSHSKQITMKVAEYISKKFEEYQGNVNIENMSSNLQMIIANILNSGSKQIHIRYIPPLNMQQFSIKGTNSNFPYGESITEDLLFRAKMLAADDINGIINKYTNSGKRLLWTVNANTRQQASNRVQQLMNKVNKKAVTTDNCLDLMSSAIFQNDSIYTAKINGERQVELETVDLGSIEDSTNSNMYLTKQLLTGSDIPPAHLGYEEWTSGKNTLAIENVVFAQSIIGYQKQFSSAITELVQKIYLAIYLNTNEFNINFKNLLLSLNSPRGITLSSYAENMNNLNTIIGVMKEIGIDNKIIINMFWPELYDQVVEADILIKQLNKESKMQQIQSVTNPQNQNDQSGGDMMGGMDFGGGNLGGGSMDMGSSDLVGDQTTDTLEKMATGGEAAPPPAEEAPPAT